MANTTPASRRQRLASAVIHSMTLLCIFAAVVGSLANCKLRQDAPLSAIQSEPAPAISSGFNMRDLETTLRRHQNIDSVGKLLENLPEEYRRHYVLLYKSASQHESSFEQPRVILFGSKPTLFLAFNGSDKVANQQQIEALQYDETTRSYTTGLVTIRSGQKPQLQTNPSGCAFCHGSSPRPLWDAYPVWSGAYASGNYKNLDEAPAFEAKQFNNFLSSATSHDRYKHLVDLPRYYNNMATMELTKTIADTTSQDIVRRIKATEHHADYKYAIQAALLGCGHVDEYLPGPLRRMFPSRIETYLQSTPRTIGTTFEDRLRWRNFNAQISPDHYLSKSINFAADDQHWNRIAALRYLLERDGRSISNWFPSLLPGSYTAGFSSTITVSLSYQHARAADINQNTSCADLKVQSLKALGKLADRGANALKTGISDNDSFFLEGAAAKPFTTYANRRAYEHVASECVSCHRTGGRATGQLIPFADTAKMAALLKSQKDLKDKILNRMNRSRADKLVMPPGAPITDAVAKYYFGLSLTDLAN